MTIQDYKIWYPYEAFYIESMLIVARAAMEAQTQLQITIDELESGKPNTQDETEYVIDLIQTFLINAGALSRYFWPSRKQQVHTLRAEKLREAFEIKEGNPLEDRDMRNCMEHFDERLDLYLSKGIAGTIIPSAVGGNMNNEQGVYHFIRAFHTADWTFEILGTKVAIIPLMKEVIRIYLLLDKFKHEGGRLPKSS
ncbi:MAG: hypothetical protein JST70_14070 [Bacteroidetes bacterium]|nr:hypothetical protein [Bacteroidota bacterium]